MVSKKIILAWIFSIVVTLVVTLFLAVPVSYHTGVLAEQSGDTPESGVTSYIKQIYDSLVSLGHGSDGAGAWGDWGDFWNRIRSAGEWEPDGTASSDDVVAGETFYGDSRTEMTGTLSLIGDVLPGDVLLGKTFYGNSFVLQTGTLALTGNATVSDVASGKTFYSDSLSQLTGTAQLAQDYELQALVEWDDYENPDYQGEESTWTNTLPLAGGEEVWQDERTGLYWSHVLSTSTTNIFPDQDHSACPFFDGSTESERLAARYGYDGLTGACGNAINACGQLSLDADGDTVDETEWYLPTQKELQQAYLDGMYNQTSSSFTTTNLFWSSSEVSHSSTYAWSVGLVIGDTYSTSKTNEGAVRCVARD